MSARSKTITVSPSAGGRLMSGLSASSAGILNYTIKRDFRRWLEREMRSEGYDRFQPNPLTIANIDAPMPAVNGEAITLVALVRAGNGRTAVVVGTKTTLFRYFGLENGAYCDPTYVEAGYFDDNPGAWVEIGSGFSRRGDRWEAEYVNGWLILNNAVDLPVSYKLNELRVIPIYEMREQGIASVGTIAEFNGMLICADIRQIKESKLIEVMSTLAIPNASQTGVESSGTARAKVNSGSAGVAGNTITATNSTFNGGSGFTGTTGQMIRMANGLSRTIASVTSATVATLAGAANLAEPDQPFYIIDETNDRLLAGIDVQDLLDATKLNDRTKLVGLKIYWDSGYVRKITGFDGDSIKVDSDQPVPSGASSIENPMAYAPFLNDSFIQRYHYRIINSMPGKPRRFGASIPLTLDPTSNVLNLDYPVKSLANGDEIFIQGAGELGGNLIAPIQWFTGKQIIVANSAITEAASAINDAITDAQTARDTAATSVSTATSTLALRLQLRDETKVASDADPTNPLLLSVAADASAAYDASKIVLETAKTALTAAEKSLTDAQAEAQPTEVEMSLADSVGSIAGFTDLEDDGSGIIRMKKLKGFLIIYKETSIFIRRFNPGNINTPFSDDPIGIPEGSGIYFKNVLSNVDGQFHLYASRDRFYTFDLSTRIPEPAALFELCGNIFFEQASINPIFGISVAPTVIDDQHGVWDNLDFDRLYQLTVGDTVRYIEQTELAPSEDFDGKYKLDWDDDPAIPILNEVIETSASNRIFSAENSVTKEIFICFPSQVTDKALRYDYAYKSVATSAMELTAACTVRRPTSGIQVGKSEDWFAMGTKTGLVLRYGRVAGHEISSAAVLASKSGETVTASAAFFTPTHVGKTIAFSNGIRFAVKQFVDATHVKVYGSGTVTSQTFKVENAIYHRDGSAYDSTLESGVDDFANTHAEKLWNEYVILLSSQSANTQMVIALRGGANAKSVSSDNPKGVEDVITTTLADPQSHNFVPMMPIQQHYLGDRIIVSGMNNPLEIEARLLNIIPVNAHSFARL